MLTLLVSQRKEYGDWQAVVEDVEGPPPRISRPITGPYVYPTLYNVWVNMHGLAIEKIVLSFNDRERVNKLKSLELSVADFSLLMDDCQKLLINATPAGQRRTI
jgi:hypothetical protein